MKKFYAPLLVMILLNVINVSKILAQGVGINTTGGAPHASAILHVDAGTSTTKGLLVTGTYNISTVPDLGAGSRLMFYPGKAAFRAGYIDGTQWNDINVGYISTAMGYNTTASSTGSTAIGFSSTASGYASTSMGSFTNATGDYSTAMGRLTRADGLYSTAMGYQTKALSNYSTAMGSGTNATADYATAMGNGSYAIANSSTAMGYQTSAAGFYSTAMGRQTNAYGEGATATGYNTTASGNYSTAMGVSVSTNGRFGAFTIGDGNPFGGLTLSGVDNQFVARFANGYYLLTSGDNIRMGVQVGANGNFWTGICDKNRKENFETLNGEDVLQKISKIKFTSWNYKQQDPKIYRHYGIMAQDFYNAFGQDKYGTIGNDTTVNPIDMIGVDMAAIQALEKRTAILNQENKELKHEMNELKLRLAKLEKQK